MGAYTKVTDAFNFIVEHPHETKSPWNCQSSRCWNVSQSLYMTDHPLVSVNEARKELFCQKNRTMENIPPTQQGPAAATKSVQCTRLHLDNLFTKAQQQTNQLLKAALDTGCRNKSGFLSGARSLRQQRL
ncbi:hypothetical protein GWK47_026500 [Chionoecetes opilio]|uniref:Uncharacterized protein n=1 Tax=Chionoecetes opilio TaxID=41210 RepID=A0A8J8WNI1_CHIOP|nr:hypothetical protein GWK47_026500 [Chionoecetes opilio]